MCTRPKALYKVPVSNGHVGFCYSFSIHWNKMFLQDHGTTYFAVSKTIRITQDAINV